MTHAQHTPDLKDQGSLCFTVSKKQLKNISTEPKTTLLRANMWYHQPQGSHSDKRGARARNVWRRKKHWKWERRDSRQEAEDKHHRKNNTQWQMTHFLFKGGKSLHMTPSVRRNVSIKNYCSWVPSVCCKSGLVSADPKDTLSALSRTDKMELSLVFTWNVSLF